MVWSKQPCGLFGERLAREVDSETTAYAYVRENGRAHAHVALRGRYLSRTAATLERACSDLDRDIASLDPLPPLH